MAMQKTSNIEWIDIGVAGLIMFTALKKLKLLRVTRDEELYGLDIALHKTLAYPEDMMEEK